MSALSVFRPDDSGLSASPPFHSDRATVAQVILWFEQNNPKPSRCAKANIERQRVRRMFVAEYGQRLCTDCRPFELLHWINQKLDKRSPWTKRRWNSTIQTPFNAAVKLGLIDRNPFYGVSFPEGEEGRDWTDQEFRALLRCSPPPLRRMIAFVRFSGARPGEGRKLLWTHIKPDARAIVMRDHKTAESTKTSRIIRFNHVLVKLLSYLRRTVPPQSRHVLLNSFMNPWSLDSLTRAIRHVRRRAKLPDDVKLHGGRHTFGTRAILNGVDVATLAQLMGHTNLRTTQRYIHLCGKDDHLNEAAELAIGKDFAK